MPGTSIPDLEIETIEETELESGWQVVLLDDNDHTYPYVIGMLMELFGHPQDLAAKMTAEVDSTGRVVVDIGSQEDAQKGRDRIQSYGPDWRLPRSSGSMSALAEPIE